MTYSPRISYFFLHSGLRPATARVGEMRVTRDLARCMRCASTSSYSGDDRRDATLGVAGVSSGVPGEPEPAPRPPRYLRRGADFEELRRGRA